ncbi:MAG: FHA domain-containing protein [Chloroflexi bacterium]|nr:FHA domain-containing protein [Chloroflexota bacterium]
MRIVVLEGEPALAKIEVDAGDILIGRADYCTVTVDHPDVSREHARIARSGGGVAILDLESRNGTLVNGERITGPRALRNGDLVVIGRTLFLVDGSPGTAPLAPVQAQGGAHAASFSTPSGAAQHSPPAPDREIDLLSSALSEAATDSDRLLRRLASARMALESVVASRPPTSEPLTTLVRDEIDSLGGVAELERLLALADPRRQVGAEMHVGAFRTVVAREAGPLGDAVSLAIETLELLKTLC